jgi:hypothetical protein
MNHPQIRLKIENPCSASWDEMQIVGEGKNFCASCEKTVIDFSGMTDEELLKFFLNNNKICGRLTEDQLNKTFGDSPAPKNKFSFKWILIPSFLLSVPGFAQQAKGKPVSTNKVSTVPQIKISTGERLITITGKIDNDSLQPVRTVIEVTNGRDSVSEFSDRSGNYSISIPCSNSDSLIISASETWSEDFTAVYRVPESDSIKCDIRLLTKIIRPIEISRTLMFGGITSTTVSGKPWSKTRWFFYKLFHPFWRRKLIE